MRAQPFKHIHTVDFPSVCSQSILFRTMPLRVKNRTFLLVYTQYTAVSVYCTAVLFGTECETNTTLAEHRMSGRLISRRCWEWSRCVSGSWRVVRSRPHILSEYVAAYIPPPHYSTTAYLAELSMTWRNCWEQPLSPLCSSDISKSLSKTSFLANF